MILRAMSSFGSRRRRAASGLMSTRRWLGRLANAPWALVLVVCSSAASCTDKPSPSSEGTDGPDASDSAVVDAELREELLDPRSCGACHTGHYDEWAGSMHAYASEDPVFLAMNRRGQEETNGELGTFCVNCHAPMAVREGLTEDGLNLQELPESVQGVTCYFCHNVESVEGEHNNPLRLSNDGVMRGPFDDPVDNPVHASSYSPHMDAANQESSNVCGACHDVQLPEAIAGMDFHLERTFKEWKETLFNRPVRDGGVTCNGCHMPLSPERDTSVQEPSARARPSRRHDFEGVDLAVTDFPGRQRQRLLTEQFLASSLLAEICVAETGIVQLTLENVGAGHHFPSGASHDREPWVELRAYLSGETDPVFETVAPELADAESRSVVLKDRVLDEDGDTAHMFWDVRELAESTTIPGVATRDPLDPNFHIERTILRFDTEQVALGAIDRVTLLLRVRPIALEVLDDLVESGHLEQEIVDAMPVLDILPDRCLNQEMVDAFPELARRPQGCKGDDPDRDYTLVWEREEATVEGPRTRRTAIDGAPAHCIAHPTYVAVPPMLQ